MGLITQSTQYLKAMMDTAMTGRGYTTFIGSPNAEGDIPSAYAAVGYGGDDRPGIVGAADDRLAYGNNTTGNRWLMWCTISKAIGDVDPIGLLSDVEDALDAFTDLLDADERLGGMLLVDGRAVLATHEWTVEDSGNIATVFFQVDITQRW